MNSQRLRIIAAMKDLRAAVPELQVGGCAPFFQSAGICFNVLCQLPVDDCLDEMYALMERWPGASDDEDFPVGGDCEYYQEVEDGTLWQNPARLELLDWLIDQLEGEQ